MKSVFGLLPPPPRIYGTPDPLYLNQLFLKTSPVKNFQVDPTTEFKAGSFTLSTTDFYKGLVYLKNTGNVTVTLASRADWATFFNNVHSSYTTLKFDQIGTTYNITVVAGADTFVVDRRQNNQQRFFHVDVFYADNSALTLYELY